MAITVGSGVTTKKIVTVGSTTQVKQVVVGAPVRRVTSGGFNIDNIDGVDTSGAVDGSLLMYSSAASGWIACSDMENQNINGGSY